MNRTRKFIIIILVVFLSSLVFCEYKFKFFLQKKVDIAYEINSDGELLKKLPSGDYVGLVTLSEMEGGFVVDNWSSDEDKVYPFVKGKVLDYWVSPDGNYIAYSVQDGLTSCCMSPPTGESNRLKIMKNDGSDKRFVDKTPRSLQYDTFPGYMIFDGWLSDSKAFVFHDQFPDESTQGSPFFLASVDGSPNRLFDYIGIILTFGTCFSLFSFGFKHNA